MALNGEIKIITLPNNGGSYAVADADARSSLYEGATGKNINMTSATSVKAPTVNYDTYDETTQANCVATMGAVFQSIRKMTESVIEGNQLVLSGLDNIHGTTLVLK